MIAWGADIGFRRVSLAALDSATNTFEVVRGVTAPADKVDDADNMALLQDVTIDLAHDLAERTGVPDRITVEVPTVVKNRANEKMHYAFALVTSALVATRFAPVESIHVATWRKLTLGHGHASKQEALEWAARIGYEGVSHDDADALGIAAASLARMKAEVDAFDQLTVDDELGGQPPDGDCRCSHHAVEHDGDGACMVTACGCVVFRPA